jgi:hypothetical protein
MMLSDDRKLNQIEKWFIQTEHLSFRVAHKLSEVYEEYQKPQHGRYSEFIFNDNYKYRDDNDWSIPK